MPRNVKIILIGDDEFWDGELHHRNPTDRSYLANLIRAVDRADPSAIALDFDFRLPTPLPADKVKVGDYASTDSYAPYRAETADLARAIGEVAQRRPIILSKTIAGPIDGPFDLMGDALQAYGICARLAANGKWLNPGTADFPLSTTAQRNIHCGYIALMPDVRRIPRPAHINGTANRLDSLPLALVRAVDEGEIQDFDQGSYYASYIDQKTLTRSNVSVSAHQVLNDINGTTQKIQGKPVIIGAAWHTRAKGEGPVVDIHDTPIGLVTGALIHENIAEAILSNRVYISPGPLLMGFIELSLGCIAIFVFASSHSYLGAIVRLLLFVVAMFVLQWIALQLLATFIDMFIPVMGLGLHAIADRFIDEEHLNNETRRQNATSAAE